MRKILTLFIILLITNNSIEIKMRRFLEGAGVDVYKIFMTLGYCKDQLLFSEQEIWGRVRSNRIFDIYYKSENDNIKVSKVEIRLVLTDSNVMGYSKEGVGQSTFTATVYLPTNSIVVFYNLKIYTCSRIEQQDAEVKDDNTNSDGDEAEIAENHSIIY